MNKNHSIVFKKAQPNEWVSVLVHRIKALVYNSVPPVKKKIRLELGVAASSDPLYWVRPPSRQHGGILCSP